MGLTAFADNAALTYLGSLVEGISDQLKYALVAGAVVGGGLTVIANAPNPAGVGISRTRKYSRTRGSARWDCCSATAADCDRGLLFWLAH